MASGPLTSLALFRVRAQRRCALTDKVPVDKPPVTKRGRLSRPSPFLLRGHRAAGGSARFVCPDVDLGALLAGVAVEVGVAHPCGRGTGIDGRAVGP